LEELLGRAHDQRGRAHVSDAADRDVHREGYRGAHRRDVHLPGALRRDRVDHGAGRTAIRDPGPHRSRGLSVLDFGVMSANFKFLIGQGLFGWGSFAGGTLRLAIPAIVLGFVLGIFVGLARLARSGWIRIPATFYVEFFRGVPLVMV